MMAFDTCTDAELCALAEALGAYPDTDEIFGKLFAEVQHERLARRDVREFTTTSDERLGPALDLS